MRKSNSIFKTAFVSESGAELTNKDYFAYVEFDDYACYVLASGITDFEISEAAKEAVEHLILSFEEHPSMSSGTLKRYMNETNERLINSSHSHRLKASVIMVVTDYEKFRYVAAGNVRLRMYRKGRFLIGSSDMSLADDLIKKGESETPLDRHEERHNLYAYLGKKEMFQPFVSKTYKLDDADIISIYTQGLWEHVDAQEIDEIFSDASDDPKESVDFLEDVLLSRQPQNLKSYTIVAIFVNKIYRDPERERKRQRYIKIALIILVILLIIGIIWYIFYRIRQDKIEEMQTYMDRTSTFMDQENFKRAMENAQKALPLSRELKLHDEEESITENVLILDAVTQANDFFDQGNYTSAYEYYIKALSYSSTSDKSTRDFIQHRVSVLESQLNLEQFMRLGDYVLQQGYYDEAEAMFRRASEVASTIHDKDGFDKAMNAIAGIYSKKAQDRKEVEQELDKKKQDLDTKLEQQRQTALTDALKKGDDLLAAGDLDGAQKAYLDARNLANNPAELPQINAALGQVSQERDKKNLEQRTSEDERKKEFSEATAIEIKGDESFAAGDYAAAQMYYLTAIEKFNALVEMNKVKSIQDKFSLARSKSFESRGTKVEAEDTEQRARNLYVDKNYEEAKAAAIKAKELYDKLGMKLKVQDMDVLLEQITTDAQIAAALK